MQKIGADPRTIRELLAGAKFEVDYYQREYRWEAKQVQELLNDLEVAFLDTYEPGNSREAVRGYSSYFLGSVIISRPTTEGPGFIVDGQQRLTTLTLLLMHLHRELEDEGSKTAIAHCIYSPQFGSYSFNLAVPERETCMDALFKGRQPNAEGHSESVQNMVARFEQIQERFSLGEPSVEEESRIDKEALPFFADWLLEKVYLVEIEASSEADTYTIFESMNDRGLRLTPTEMLKGYLLNNVSVDDRKAAGDIWKSRIVALQEWSEEETALDADAIKAWLRSQHAVEIRERRKNAPARDFERIGTEFHRWVRDKRTDLGLNRPSDFFSFIKEDFKFFTLRYEQICDAAGELTPGLEAIHYNNCNNFTLQETLLLAPLTKTDSATEIERKFRIVASYLDILIARRIWNFHNFGYSTMSYAMFSLSREIRHKTATELAQLLVNRLLHEETFADNTRFYLHGRNRPNVRYVLARVTDYVESSSGMPTRFDEYMKGGNQGHEIEHIWGDRYERHQDEFEHPENFQQSRNKIGGLLLLPKSFNASYGDMEYAVKRDHYFGQNLLAKSLHDLAYENHPGFRAFISRSGLPFRPHSEFKRADNEMRQNLYLRIAESIWDPDNLLRIAEE